MNKLTKKDSGFTIIEVVLVLAIAGLIFLTVFLALPALQRSQRDTQRRSDVGRVVAGIQTYQSNHNGALPASATDWTSFATNYITGTFSDPSGSAYLFSAAGTGAGPDAISTTVGTIYYKTDAKCPSSGSDTFVTGAGARSVAISTKMEGGGSYCANN